MTVEPERLLAESVAVIVMLPEVAITTSRLYVWGPWSHWVNAYGAGTFAEPPLALKATVPSYEVRSGPSPTKNGQLPLPYTVLPKASRAVTSIEPLMPIPHS